MYLHVLPTSSCQLSFFRAARAPIGRSIEEVRLFGSVEVGLTCASDCKSPLRSEEWKPIWKLEERQPDFHDDEDLRGSALYVAHIQLSLHVIKPVPSSWTSITPVDVLNLQQPSSQNISLLFLSESSISFLAFELSYVQKRETSKAS